MSRKEFPFVMLFESSLPPSGVVYGFAWSFRRKADVALLVRAFHISLGSRAALASDLKSLFES